MICAGLKVRGLLLGGCDGMEDTKRDAEFWWGNTAKRPLLGDGEGAGQ